MVHSGPGKEQIHMWEIKDKLHQEEEMQNRGDLS